MLMQPSPVPFVTLEALLALDVLEVLAAVVVAGILLVDMGTPVVEITAELVVAPLHAQHKISEMKSDVS